jgi:hypothetical protein
MSLWLWRVFLVFENRIIGTVRPTIYSVPVETALANITRSYSGVQPSTAASSASTAR